MKTRAQLQQEIDHLRDCLGEAEAALDAIHSGEIDALVVSSSLGEQIFTLQGAEHPYRVMVESMNEGAATVLEDGCMLYANPRLAGMLGEPVETLIGSSLLDYISPEDILIFEGLVEQGFQSSTRAELRFRSRDGSYLPALISISPTQVDGAQALCLVAADLTEQKRSEEILAAERLARSILDQAAEAILVCDNGGKIIRANQAAFQICPQNPLYKPFEAALPLIFNQPCEGGTCFSITDVLMGESFQGIEAEYPSSGDGVRYFLLSAAPLFRSRNTVIGCVITLAEITEMKQAEEALRASEERLVDFLESTHDSFFALDRDWRVIYANRRYCEIVQKDPQELIGKDFWGTFPKYKDDQIERYYRKAMEQGVPVQFQSPGFYSQSWYDVAVYPTRDGISVFATDRTEEYKAVEALRESEKRFRTMADGTPVIIWVNDANGRIEFVNRAYCEFFGVTQQQVQSEGWQPLVHPEDAAGYTDGFMDCIRERQPFRAEARVRIHNGEWRWIASQGQPRFSDSGVFLGIAGSSLDITERKQAEEAIKTYSARLERSNKELQEFAFIASHDLQEPLRKIEAFSRQVGKCSELQETEQDYLRRMQDAAGRMRQMIDDLLELSRVTTRSKPYEPVDLNTMAKMVMGDLEHRLRQSGGRVEIVDPLPVIEADPTQMQQLLQNLMVNAIKYHRKDVPPVVQVGCRAGSPGWKEIYVQDNGIGFDMSYVDQIFQPFRRLHGRHEYEGSGIGLALCRKIAERHGGRITAQSIPGQGSTFLVTLPVQQAKT